MIDFLNHSSVGMERPLKFPTVASVPTHPDRATPHRMAPLSLTRYVYTSFYRIQDRDIYLRGTILLQILVAAK